MIYILSHAYAQLLSFVSLLILSLVGVFYVSSKFKKTLLKILIGVVGLGIVFLASLVILSSSFLAIR
jgi:hypothetical protein